MSEELYRAIEERHGFSLPPEYRRMHARGFLTLDRPAHASEFAEAGSGYLWLNDMEWYPLAEIATFAFPHFCEPHLPHLVPFAFTASGDYWCWQTDQTDERGTRVLLCPHDYTLATIHAPNFAAALYRQALSYACYYADFDQDRPQNRAFLNRWATDLACVFPAAWCQNLKDLAGRTPVAWTDRFAAHESFLTPDEMKQIEERDIAFPELDVEIPWCF